MYWECTALATPVAYLTGRNVTTQPPAETVEQDKLGRRRPDYLKVDGDALRKLRLLRTRNQTEAAAIGGIARNHWSAIETGLRPTVRPSTAFKLAKGVAAEGASRIEIGAIVPQFARVPDRGQAPS